MTTAHRPTWAPAVGGEEQGGMRMFQNSRAYSAKDQAAHTKMKTRGDGQASMRDLKEKDLRAELLSKEKEHFTKTGQLDFAEERNKDMLLLAGAPAAAQKSKVLVPRAADADIDDGDESSSDDESSDDEDDSDDEEALQAELARIRAERAEEAAKKAAEESAAAQKVQEEELIRSNPLMAEKFGVKEAGGFQVKRRWDDDVVFRNQARGEPKAQKRFINDTIRNDFHKKFLHRYIK